MPVAKLPRLGHKDVDLHTLYKEVIGRGGVMEVINKKCWKEVASVFNFPSTCTNAGYTLRINYMKLLYPYELKYFHGLSDEEVQTRIQHSGLPNQQVSPIATKESAPSPINKPIATIAASSTAPNSPFKGTPPASPLATNNLFSPTQSQTQPDEQSLKQSLGDSVPTIASDTIKANTTGNISARPPPSPILVPAREYTVLTKRSVVPGIQSKLK